MIGKNAVADMADSCAGWRKQLTDAGHHAPARLGTKRVVCDDSAVIEGSIPCGRDPDTLAMTL